LQRPQTRKLQATPLQESHTVANLRGALLATHRAWTFSCACSNRPKGQQRTAQAAFATLWRARSLYSVRPNESAATKAFRSRAFRPGTAVWTYSCVCFQSPDGRIQNSPRLQPWEQDAQRNRPERASESESAGNEEYVVIIFDGAVPFSPSCVRSLTHEVLSSCFRKTLPLEMTPGSRPPFQGDSDSMRRPRAEALGCYVFALRATVECLNSGGVACNAGKRGSASSSPPEILHHCQPWGGVACNAGTQQ